MPNRNRLKLYSYFSPRDVSTTSLLSATYWQAAAPHLLPPLPFLFVIRHSFGVGGRDLAVAEQSHARRHFWWSSEGEGH
jgi:hypothetical protein